MSPAWRWFLPGYVLALPHTIIGLLIAVLFYRCHSWKWSDGCIEAIGGEKNGETRIWGSPGAQTHGFLIIYRDERRRDLSWLRVHERVHVVQAFIGSALYPIAYGLSFAWLYATAGMQDWWAAYERIPFEVMARGRADDVQRVEGSVAGRWGA